VQFRIPQDDKINRDIDYFQQLADGAPVMIWMSGPDPVMIWMSGPDMGCFYFNRAWLDFRGRTTEEEFGNGWAEGVHPEDLDRCVEHYVSCFQRRFAFAMSYRLQHHSGEYRWMLNRGPPHFDADGQFIGFYGGCAELAADVSVPRMPALRVALQEMRDFAARVAAANVSPLQLDHRIRHNAAAQLRNLAADMIGFDRIENGACLR
jgi:PAS domain S-box-containing protein